MKIFTRIVVFISCGLALLSCEENINAPEVSDQEFSINENAPSGTPVGVVDAYDLDEGQGFSYGILEGNEGGTFSIDPKMGLISVADPLLLDYETTTAITFTVVVSDDARDPKESSANITVSLNDLNEFAPVVDDQTFEIQEDPASGALIGMIQASDQEAHQSLLFTILSGNDNEVFALDETTGALSVNDPAAFDYLVNKQFMITVHVRDIHLDSKTDTAIITVNVLPE